MPVRKSCSAPKRWGPRRRREGAARSAGGAASRPDPEKARDRAPGCGMRRGPLWGHRFDSVIGFTLVELVVVMAIVLLASLLVMVNARPLSRNRSAETPALVEYLRQQQALAVKNGKTLCIQASGGADRLQALPDGGVYTFRAGEELRVIAPSSPAADNAPPSLCFHPDGILAESRWRLMADHKIYTIMLSPFADEIGVFAEPPG